MRFLVLSFSEDGFSFFRFLVLRFCIFSFSSFFILSLFDDSFPLFHDGWICASCVTHGIVEVLFIGA